MKKTIFWGSISLIILTLAVISFFVICSKQDEGTKTPKTETPKIDIKLVATSVNTYKTKTFTIQNNGCDLNDVHLEFAFKSAGKYQRGERYLLQFEKNSERDLIFGESEYPKDLKIVEVTIKCKEGEKTFLLFHQ